MKWLSLPKKPKPGDIRRIKKFLFFPRHIRAETRWLCASEILQIYSESGTSTGYDFSFAGWKDVEWSEKVKDIEIGEPRLSFLGSPYTSYKIIYNEGYNGA